jgi:hypothetical protein
MKQSVKTKITYTAIATLIVFCFSSCKNKQKNDAVKIVTEWTDKGSPFPRRNTLYVYGERHQLYGLT